jgi:hypothetical protein
MRYCLTFAAFCGKPASQAKPIKVCCAGHEASVESSVAAGNFGMPCHDPCHSHPTTPGSPDFLPPEPLPSGGYAAPGLVHGSYEAKEQVQKGPGPPLGAR